MTLKITDPCLNVLYGVHLGAKTIGVWNVLSRLHRITPINSSISLNIGIGLALGFHAFISPLNKAKELYPPYWPDRKQLQVLNFITLIAFGIFMRAAMFSEKSISSEVTITALTSLNTFTFHLDSLPLTVDRIPVLVIAAMVDIFAQVSAFNHTDESNHTLMSLSLCLIGLLVLRDFYSRLQER